MGKRKRTSAFFVIKQMLFLFVNDNYYITNINNIGEGKSYNTESMLNS